MRIIAGIRRGRNLKTVEGLSTRPTSDKVKGAIFNVLRDKVIDSKVLDLFAGTGSLAIEALSRGAAEAVLVEESPAALKIIMENLKIAGLLERTKLRPQEALRFLASNQEVFDLIFLDPPYQKGLIEQVLLILANPCRLSPNGVIVAETSKDEEIDVESYPFEVRKVSKYGDTKVWYLQKKVEL
ncbi:MAG: 16S rRNA (guanine(966)-N(2))-methyltransferase RsmD [Desulfitobacteriaceae bacterium]|nr:16S rRNA (guanine(966)-N(2))-methyltransferase RsmD [Desulfitobacteriaceae bacterium]MDD4346314.1 16S rRNA (guanine(966)-N(2))-methyltransferase RsmD [Desulfitobacteriaceae bacterium]MDD4400552.1 16S rRNA (guanine(966)-N(2))-methyltransferase RsmD [Desulfitobacteriaceae bacterium]